MVVGMHRSGTSFLTGSLQLAGLELGKHSAWNPHNLKGNRENEDIVIFHDELLARHGFAWDNPPPSSLTWTEPDRQAARQWMAQYEGISHWGFKDPRSLLLVEGWQRLVPNLRFIGIFRHPVAVARSLDARGGMPQGQAFALWKAYNSKLLALHKIRAFPVLCFDEDENTLHQKLDSVLAELGLKSPPDERFFSSELKHHKAENSPVPDDLHSLYDSLQRVAR